MPLAKKIAKGIGHALPPLNVKSSQISPQSVPKKTFFGDRALLTGASVFP